MATANTRTHLLSPSYGPQLHIVVQGPDGSVAAFAGFTIDTANQVAMQEPVRHQGRVTGGSAWPRPPSPRAFFGSPARGWVSSTSPTGAADAGHLYGSLGFEHYATQTAWRKVLGSVSP